MLASGIQGHCRFVDNQSAHPLLLCRPQFAGAAPGVLSAEEMSQIARVMGRYSIENLAFSILPINVHRFSEFNGNPFTYQRLRYI